ncbi:MAG: aldehyde dehydrogenase family protein [Candidatus Marinimicrobia bacterium]|nr:aldehyde dehydrogenase family protein [Candidatus Neomarinimicrobiota bacterium]
MKMLIGGQWIEKSQTIDVLNPFDGSVIDTVPAGTAEDVHAAIDIAQKGYEINRDIPIHKRISILKKAADLMQARYEELAVTIATEGSKTIQEARKEVGRAINTITISAEEARRINGETIPFDSAEGSENRVGYYYRSPIGIIAAITPFNDPLNLVAHKVGPAIAGGNAVIVKPATVTPLSALKLAECLLDAGLPGEILSVVTGYGNQIGEALVSDPRIRMVSFTGGGEAGERITRLAGLKKIGMELGSNSPVIVLGDADMEKAVESCVSGAFYAVGQNCIGVQRIYINEKIYDDFRNRFVSRTQKYKTGSQLDENTDMGPMITESEAIRVIDWVNESVSQGATCLTGGTRNYTLVQPTVMENMPNAAKLNCQEVFGPVVSLYSVASLEEAVQKSNAVNYGLHAAIFTKDLENAFYAIRHLDVGSVIVNDSTDYRVDLMPFGGVKQSGLGREGIRFALQEMTEPKVVCFNL